MSKVHPGYKYHVFLSYSRAAGVPEWIDNHFLPVLKNRLEALLNEDPIIYIDKQIEVGADWPDALAEALNLSCHLLAVWTPKYFRSAWCTAELHTMIERERLLGLRPRGNGPGLIYPVVYSDGEHFPEEAKRIQYRTDLRDFAYPYPQFKNSEKYLAFHDKVNEVAEDLARRLGSTPPWDPAWPSVKPAPTAPYLPRFARL